MTYDRIFQVLSQLDGGSVGDGAVMDRPNGDRGTARRREFSGAAPAAVTALSLSRPFPKIAQDKAAVAVLTESTGVIQHDVELFIFKLSSSFEILKIDTSKCSVIGLEDADAASGSGLDLFQIAISLEQCH